MKQRKGLSRRDFLKRAAVGAGVAAAVATTSKTDFVAKAAAEEVVPPIKIPDMFEISRNAPLPKIDFPMTVANVFGMCCKAEGLAASFSCPGNYETEHAIAEQGIPVFSGRDEATMASAADGFCRVTGEIAACSSQYGATFNRMVGAFCAANSSSSPVLITSRTEALPGEDSGHNRTIHGTIFDLWTTAGVTKWGKRIIDPKRVWEYTSLAFRQLKTGIPKPVYLAFPENIAAVKIQSGKEQQCYWDVTKTRTEAKPYPDPKYIRAAVDLLKKAQRPMIVSSVGVLYSNAWDILKAFAEKIQIPVTESGPQKGQFSDGHPLSASAALDCYASADVVMLVGQYHMPPLGGEGTGMGGFNFGPDTKYIRIDPDAGDIGREMPIEVGIVSDEKAALEALYNELPSMKHDSWIAEVQAARKQFEGENADIYARCIKYCDTNAVHPAAIGKGLSDFLYKGKIPREQTTVVSGGFGIARYTRRWLRSYRPAQMIVGPYCEIAVGPDIGYSIGAAAAVQLGIGPQAAYKGGPVVCVTGDAGFAFTAMDLDTLAKYRLPAIVIIYNNNSWGTWQSYKGRGRVEHLHVFQENLRYDKVCEALGGYGEYVRKAEDLLPALERAYEVAITKRLPSVINVQAKKEFWDAKAYPPGILGKPEPGVTSYYY